LDYDTDTERVSLHLISSPDLELHWEMTSRDFNSKMPSHKYIPKVMITSTTTHQTDSDSVTQTHVQEMDPQQ
jgi:hypothetical protein